MTVKSFLIEIQLILVLMMIVYILLIMVKKEMVWRS